LRDEAVGPRADGDDVRTQCQQHIIHLHDTNSRGYELVILLFLGHDWGYGTYPLICAPPETGYVPLLKYAGVGHLRWQQYVSASGLASGKADKVQHARLAHDHPAAT
jgi:hypothetical protein